MITNITLHDFKCFHRISVDPKLITVFIGPNGTGKSGILQALLLLKQSRSNVDHLAFNGELIRFPRETFRLHTRGANLDGVRLSLSGCSCIGSEGLQEPLEFQIDLEYSEQASLKVDRGSTSWWDSGKQYRILFERNQDWPQVVTPRGAIVYNVEAPVNSFSIRASTGGEDQSSPLWQQMSQAPAEMLANLRSVPAARGLIRDVYELGPDSSVDISGASGLGTQEDNTATTLAYSRQDVEKVSCLMRRITGMGFRVDTVPPQSARPVSESLAGDLSLLAEGFGTNALVHLLFVVVRTASGATVLIEEPEIHLHPKAQADLASELVKEAKSSGKQMVMTTHSEHLAGRLLTLVAEETLSVDELAIYSFEKDETGVCSATEVEVTDMGQVKGGLKGFFETDLDEMRRYVEALRGKV